MKITMADLTLDPVSVRRIRKVAPCGSCRKETNRDDMWAMNTLFASPHDGQKDRVRVRLCASCADEQKEALKSMEWDNSSMRVLD